MMAAMLMQLNDRQKKRIARLLPRLLLAGFFGLLLLVIAAMGLYWRQVQRAPDQPIAFAHSVHAGTLEIACSHCHAYADKSPRAGVPTLNICMTCHQTMATDRPEVAKLRDYVDAKQPVVWNRVHALPGFVDFTHKRHILAGIDCFACHGAVATMVKVRQVRPLNMGWCLTCHRTNGASTDCATCHL